MRPVRDAVPGALAELLRAAPLSPGKARFAWGVAVGPALARVTAVRLEGQVLIVDTVSAQWARELTRLSGAIRARVGTLLGADAVTRIDVRVAPNLEPQPPNPEPAPRTQNPEP